MQNEIKYFIDLKAWHKNHELVLEIYKINKQFPKEELYGLSSQIRRAVVSITSNIAEGFGRYYFKEKIRFYTIARGSATEVQNQLIIAKDLCYITKEEFNKIKVISFEGYKLICGIIVAMEKAKKIY
ncbi:four helix bundle protein [Candidatus Falkowbacteria bacterium CG10_big_fil_rev_8_21_14_0_10_37_6]|uniref:Four helix bundle protein n=1 Tax=Candidatus Falkowbacteria bacterium CG10_big_fil_rev_8_21_14_0_10_37_6 TaxID=1974563 RepID=A0A2H0V9M9_9BACT|nr:MAG: four helix bundle protein [Candidatus Falkowbacteria bacterium CG10_big_fil_rev_8_21_14_0_10_37_6]